MPSDELIQIALVYADRYLLDPSLVCALIDHESDWNTFAFKPPQNAMPLLGCTSQEKWGRSMTWGLMQLKGDFARELGFTGRFLSELCEPITGIDYGCRRLNQCANLHPRDEAAALSLYSLSQDRTYARVVQSLKSKYYLKRRIV